MASVARRVVPSCCVAALLLEVMACSSSNAVGPFTGSIDVRISISGVDVPPAGVNVAVDGSPPVEISNDSSFRFARLANGVHTVAVTGVAANCTSAGALTQQVDVTANAEASVSFAFTCQKASLNAHGVLAFERPNSIGAFDIWVMNADGTGETNLTNSPSATDVWPTWLADGSRIFFLTGSVGDVASINRDGTGFTKLTNDGRRKTTPAVSPDGSRIAFAMGNSESNLDIWLVNIDGSNFIQLTSDAAYEDHPAWSPDGTKIVFRRANPAPVTSLFVMNSDGTNVQQLSAPGFTDADPTWSPDGSRIAFDRLVDGIPHIAVMNADGSNVKVLTSGSAYDETPAWSADATKIAFGRAPQVASGIWIMNADGTNQVRVSPLGVYDIDPAWSK